MTSELPHFSCFFAAGSWEKDIENGAAVTSLRSFLFRDDFNKLVINLLILVTLILATNYLLLTQYILFFTRSPVPPMLVLTPFVPRDSFIKADAQQIQLMYFPATYPPTTHLATYTIIHSVESTSFLDLLYFSKLLIKMKTISLEYRTRLHCEWL